MHTPLKYLLAVVLGTLAVLAFVGCDATTRAQLEGILQNVDSVSGEVTVKLKDGGTVTFNLKDVSVETLSNAVGNASLEAGSQVTIEVDQNNKAKKLKAHAAEAEGVIKSLGEGEKTVTISLEKGGEITLEVTETTKIEVEDQEGSAVFAALRVGQEVEAKYDVETKKALKIEVDEVDEEDEEAEGAEADVKGVITSISNEAKTITIRAENGIETTLKMMSHTELEGVKTFDALTTGMRVKVEFNPDTKELIELDLKE